MLTGNKGEWSEVYVLLRLLGQGRLYSADENTKRIEYMYFPILKIIRDEILKSGHNHIEYVDYDTYEKKRLEKIGIFQEKGDTKQVAIFINDSFYRGLSRDIFDKEADYLFDKITSGSNTFSIDRTEGFLNLIGCYTLKAPSTDKTDITIQIHDIQTGYEPICGFSIKSNVGSAPTLLNPSGATNIVYKVEGLNRAQISSINEIETKTKIIDRMRAIKAYGGQVSYSKFDSDIFVENLMLIDTFMPDIVANMLLYSVEEGKNGISDLIEIMESKNPLGIKRKGFYRYKVKKLLVAIALGMTAGIEWSGIEEANGGYIIVNTEGDVLAYHIYNRENFEEYLVRNTRLDRPSTSRYNYASIYDDNGEYYIKQNLQIRFV